MTTTTLKIPTHPLIGEVEARMRAQFTGNPSSLVATLEQLIMAGGKRIRPTITLLLGSMFGTEQDALLNLAAAVEMMHTATLVHDALIDKAGHRRAQPTMNPRFSTSATVLAGDLAFAAASKLAAATNQIKVMQKFSTTLEFIVNGEITYMFSNGIKTDLEAYYDWIHAKTASVFELASGMAAAIGSANPDEVEAAAQFGYDLGMAFQITDDILDFTGDPDMMAKPVGSDLRQGTITLPTLLYQQHHPDDLDIASISKQNGNGHARIEDLITAISQSEAIHQAQESAHRFLQHGLDALVSLPETPERADLALIASQVVKRNH